MRVDGFEYETWLNASDDVKKPGESKVALDIHYELNKNEDESPLDFCIRKGWGHRIWQMLIVDYLILNRDRHGANIEVPMNRRARTIRLAPLFDHGLSLLFRCRTDAEVAAFNVLADLPVQSFVGTASAERNLNLIPIDEFPSFGMLYEEDRNTLFDGLEEATSQQWSKAVWSMIWLRWRRLEALRAGR